MSQPTVRDVMTMLDHSLLRPTLTLAELEAGCHDALSLGVASVCVLPYFVARSAAILAGSSTLPSTVLAFPHGALALPAKLAELCVALEAGAKEVDVVVNISQVKSHAFDDVEREVLALTRQSQQAGTRIKLIFETCYLSDIEKRQLCAICGSAGVDWVKTSTGFGSHGATLDDVALLRQHTPLTVQVKASGGIRSLDDVLSYRQAGATRVGTSASRGIFEEAKARLSSA